MRIILSHCTRPGFKEDQVNLKIEEALPSKYCRRESVPGLRQAHCLPWFGVPEPLRWFGRKKTAATTRRSRITSTDELIAENESGAFAY